MKKIMKLLSTMVLGLLLVITGCSSQTPQDNDAGATGESSQEQIKIGIAQIVEHPSLDEARRGFLDALNANGYIEGENLVVDYQNAQNDMNTLNTIANNLKSENPDLILAIATPTAQAIANATQGTDIPVLFTAVTDPVSAGLVQSMEEPGTNLTGTTDMAPVADQIALIKEINPDVKSVGVLYNTSEINSAVQLEIAKEAAEKLGLEIVEVGVTSTNEVDLAVKSLIGKVQAIYVPTDNTVVAALEAVINVAEENKIPVISSEKDSVKRGAVATLGLDYYKLGYQTGEMAIKILKGEATPDKMPVESQAEQEVILNMKAAEAMGVTLPQELIDRAVEVIMD